MPSVSVSLKDAYRRLGARGATLPELADELVGTFSFGDVSGLVPVPTPPRAIASHQFVAAAFYNTLTLKSCAPGGLFVEKLLIMDESSFVRVGLTDAVGLTLGVIADLGERPTCAELTGGQAGMSSFAPIPASTIDVNWYVPPTRALYLQSGETPKAATLGFVFREFETVRGPE